jgi:type IV pilus biogenesis/stability protein PilW
MSLIVDVLKRVQKDGVAKGPALPFIKYPYEEGLCLRAFISKNAWLFRFAIGLSMAMILAISVMMLQATKSSSRADVSGKTVAGITTPSQESFVASPEVESSEDKSTPGQEKKTQAIEPEKKIRAPFSKGKEMKSGSHSSPSGKVLVEKGPTHTISHHFELAVSYQRRGEKAKAMEEYRKVIEIDPINVGAHNNLGVIYKDMGKLNRAAEEFHTVLSLDPQQEKAHNNLGVVFYLQGNLEKAIEEFRGVLDANPNNRDAYTNLGVIYKRQNLVGKAKSMFEKALSIDPDCPEAHYNLGLICEENGYITEAMSYYKKFVGCAGTTYGELTTKVKRHLETLSSSRE